MNELFETEENRTSIFSLCPVLNFKTVPGINNSFELLAQRRKHKFETRNENGGEIKCYFVLNNLVWFLSRQYYVLPSWLFGLAAKLTESCMYV